MKRQETGGAALVHTDGSSLPISVRGLRARGARPLPLDVLKAEEWRRLVKHLKLSPREAEIAQSALRNDKVACIAVQLRLSPHTIHTYRERLFRKLGVRSNAELVGLLFATHVAFSRSEAELSR